MTWTSPQTEHQGISDAAAHETQTQKFPRKNGAEESFQRIKKELREAPALGMPTEKGMYVLDTYASVVVVSGILDQ